MANAACILDPQKRQLLKLITLIGHLENTDGHQVFTYPEGPVVKNTLTRYSGCQEILQDDPEKWRQTAVEEAI